MASVFNSRVGIWWIGFIAVLLPLIVYSAGNGLLPIISYFGTSSLWTISERVLKIT
jgi:hypothetical protein